MGLSSELVLLADSTRAKLKKISMGINTNDYKVVYDFYVQCFQEILKHPLVVQSINDNLYYAFLSKLFSPIDILNLPYAIVVKASVKWDNSSVEKLLKQALFLVSSSIPVYIYFVCHGGK